MHALQHARHIVDQVAMPVASAAIVWRWPFEQVAIPAAVLFMAFLGAAIWVFLEQPRGSRMRVYGTAICYALLSSAGAVFIVHAVSLDRALGPPLALLIASGGKVFFNAFREGAAERIRNRAKGDP
jgi:hypothetical protein